MKPLLLSLLIIALVGCYPSPNQPTGKVRVGVAPKFSYSVIEIDGCKFIERFGSSTCPLLHHPACNNLKHRAP